MVLDALTVGRNDQGDVRGQRADRNQRRTRHLGRVARDHQRDEGIAESPPETEHGRGGQPLPAVGKYDPQKLAGSRQAQGLARQSHLGVQLFDLGVNQQHQGRQHQHGQDGGRRQPAEPAAVTEEVADQRHQQEYRHQGVNHRRNAGQEMDDRRQQPGDGPRRHAVDQAADADRDGVGQRHAGHGQRQRTDGHGQDAVVALQRLPPPTCQPPHVTAREQREAEIDQEPEDQAHGRRRYQRGSAQDQPHDGLRPPASATAGGNAGR